MNLDELGKCSTISVEEWGELWGVSRGTAYASARANEIPGMLQIGSRYRISAPVTLRLLLGGETDLDGTADVIPMREAARG